MIGVYGNLKIEQQMKQRMPMMSESSSFPRTKPLKMRSASATARSVKNDAACGCTFHEAGTAMPVTAMARRYSSE